MNARLLWVPVVVAALLTAPACGDSDTSTYPPVDAPDASTRDGSDEADNRFGDIGADASLDRSTADVDAPEHVDLFLDESPAVRTTLRVIHAAPGAPVLDAHLDGGARVHVARIGFGEASDRLVIDAGNYTLSVRPDDRLPDAAQLLASEELTIPEGSSVTAIITHAATSGLDQDDATDLEMLLLSESFQSPPEGRAALRFVHAAGNTPPLQLDLRTDGVPDFIPVEPMGATCAPGVLVRSGKPIRAAVWADGDAPQMLTTFTLPPLDEHETVLLILTGRIDRLPREQSGLALLPIGDTEARALVRQDPLVYVMHASANAPPMDVFLDQTELANHIAFGELSAPIQLSPGSYLTDLYANDLDLSNENPPSEVDEPLATCEVTEIVAGERYLAIAAGAMGQLSDEFPLEIMTLRDGFDLDEPLPLLRLVNVSPLDSPLQLSIFDGGGLLDQTQGSLDYGDASRETGIPLLPGPLLFKLSLADIELAQLELIAELGDRLVLVIAGTTAVTRSAESGGRFGAFLIDTTRQPWLIHSL